jgi:glycopeptide antibiotics resistance protein
MGKREVRTVVVSKRVSAVLLVVTSACLAGMVAALSGRAYASTPLSIRELVSRAMEGSPHAFLVTIMPLVANALLFVPWGFFAFMVFDRPPRSRARTYAMTIAAGLIFAAAVALWQSFMPTRVTTIADSAANAAGTLAGAVFAHLRKGVRVRFDY